MYEVIEYTAGYLPEDDSPPQFDQYSEALNYLVAQRMLLIADNETYETPQHEIGLISDGQFQFLWDVSNRTDLPRIVKIVEVNDD